MSEFQNFLEKNRGKIVFKRKAKEHVHEAQEMKISLQSLKEETTPSFEALPSGYIGAFTYVPDPNLVGEGAEYRNINEGKVYKKVGQLWEVYLQDGKNGTVPRVWPQGGGLGERDVRAIVAESTSAVSSGPIRLTLLNGVTTSGVSATPAGLQSFSASSDFNQVILQAYGPNTGIWTAQVRFFTSNDGGATLTLVATSNLSNAASSDNATLIISNKMWVADIVVVTGTIPVGGVTAKVLI